MKRNIIKLITLIVLANKNNKKKLLHNYVKPDSSNVSNKIILKWYTCGSDEIRNITKYISNEFNKNQSKIIIQHYFNGTYENNVKETIQALKDNNPPHLSLIFEAGMGNLLATHKVYPLSTLIKTQDYVDSIKKFFEDDNNNLNGIPFNNSTPIMYYNASAFNKINKKPPRTWEEFEKVAPELINAGYTPLAQNHSAWIWIENLHSIHNKSIPNKELINMHVTKIKEWQKKKYYKYYGKSGKNNTLPFFNGDVAILLGSSVLMLYFIKYKFWTNIKIETALLPYWETITKKSYCSFPGGTANFTFKGFSDKEYIAIRNFLEYLKSDIIRKKMYKQLGCIPVTKNIYEEIKSYKGNKAIKTAINQLELNPPDNKNYKFIDYLQKREKIMDEYHKLLTGKQIVTLSINNIIDILS
jgi:sn-glycerol 3-phosphate transport system substrate-binding protein